MHGSPLKLMVLVCFCTVVLVSGALPAGAGIKCGDGEVFDPKTGTCVADGGDDGDDGDKSPNPPKEPKQGKERTGTRYQVPCTLEPMACHSHVPTCQEPGKRTMVYTRLEIYGGSRWERAPGPAGEWTFDGVVCRKPAEPQGPTEGDVWSALVEFGIPGGKTIIEPPNGKTLVNFETNFYTTKRGDTLPLQVGPYLVDIKAKAASYEWHWDDDTRNTTTTGPGHEAPEVEITHRYTELGDYDPSVTIHYDVWWRENGTADWQKFDGTLEASTSPTTDLQVVGSQIGRAHV